MALTGIAKAYARRIDRGEITLNDVPTPIKEQVESLIVVTVPETDDAEIEEQGGDDVEGIVV